MGRKKPGKPKGDAISESESAAGRRVRHTESEMSSTEMDEEIKRFKPGSPGARRATRAMAADAAVESVAEGMEADVPVVPTVSNVVADGVSDSTAVREPRPSRPVARRLPRVGGDPVTRMKETTNGLMALVMAEEVDRVLARKVMEIAGTYEAQLFGLMAENERLRGKMEVLEARGGAAPAAMMPPPAPVVASTVAKTAASRIPKVLAEPVGTWAVVARGGSGTTSAEVMKKVEQEVGPTLGVRVHEMRPLKRTSGVVLRTRSVAERQKVAENTKFKEVGLEVTVRDKLGPRVTVRRVDPEFTPDEFMQELYNMNFKDELGMTMEEFKRSVRLVSEGWKREGGPVNVVLEGSAKAMRHLLMIGRVYVKWYSYVVREQEVIPTCHRCLGFDHMVRECRAKENVCRNCCQTGHVAPRCVNPTYCRNCAFKRLPSDHLMLSSECPVYSAMVARANARH